MSDYSALVIVNAKFSEIPQTGQVLKVGDGITGGSTDSLSITAGGTGTDKTITIGSVGTAGGASNVINLFGASTDDDAGTLKVHGLVEIDGDLTVSGNENVIGTSTFDDAALFKGPVDFGDGISTNTDTISFDSTSAVVDTDIPFIPNNGTALYLKAKAETTAGNAGTPVGLQAGDAGTTYAGAGANIILTPGGGTAATRYGAVVYGPLDSTEADSYEILANTDATDANKAGLRYNHDTGAWQMKFDGGGGWTNIAAGSTIADGSNENDRLYWTGAAWSASADIRLGSDAANDRKIYFTQTPAGSVAGKGIDVDAQVGGAASGAAGGAGGLVTVNAGTGGAGDATYAAGAGGALGLYGGNAGAATSTGALGGGITVSSGSGSGALASGGVDIKSANATATGASGAVTLSSGSSSAGNSGSVSIYSGAASGAGDTGDVNVYASASSSGTTGAVRMFRNVDFANAAADTYAVVDLNSAALTNSASGFATGTRFTDTIGMVWQHKGDGYTVTQENAPAATAGGPLTLQGGRGTGAGGGAVTLQGGNAETTGSGGSVSLVAGTSAAGTGGSVSITASAGAGVGNSGGAVTITSGSGGASATSGGLIRLQYGAPVGLADHGYLEIGPATPAELANAYQIICNTDDATAEAGLRYNNDESGDKWQVREDGDTTWYDIKHSGNSTSIEPGTADYQILQWNDSGSSWDPSNNLTLPDGAARTIAMEDGANGYALTIHGQDGAAAANEGGDVTVRAGDGSSAVGGDLFLWGGDGSTDGNIYIGGDGLNPKADYIYIGDWSAGHGLKVSGGSLVTPYEVAIDGTVEFGNAADTTVHFDATNARVSGDVYFTRTSNHLLRTADAQATEGAGLDIGLQSGGATDASAAGGDINLLLGTPGSGGARGSIYFGAADNGAVEDGYQLLANTEHATKAGLRYNNNTNIWEYRVDGGGSWLPLTSGGGVLPTGSTAFQHLRWDTGGTGSWVTEDALTLPSGGDRTITIDISSAGAGHTLTVSGGAPQTTSQTGGSLLLEGHDGGGTSGNGGAVTVTAGDAGGDGNGGDISLTAGQGGLSAGNVPGDITIAAGLSTNASSAGGSITISGGNSASTGTGGDLTIRGGAGIGSGAISGDTLIYGAAAASGTGGDIEIQAGTGSAFASDGSTHLSQNITLVDLTDSVFAKVNLQGENLTNTSSLANYSQGARFKSDTEYGMIWEHKAEGYRIAMENAPTDTAGGLMTLQAGAGAGESGDGGHAFVRAGVSGTAVTTGGSGGNVYLIATDGADATTAGGGGKVYLEPGEAGTGGTPVAGWVNVGNTGLANSHLMFLDSTASEPTNPATNGTASAGIRSNAGVMEYKDTAGTWTAFNASGGAYVNEGTVTNQVLQWNNSTSEWDASSDLQLPGTADRTIKTADRTDAGNGWGLNVIGGAANTSGDGGLLQLVGGAAVDTGTGGGVTIIGGAGAGVGGGTPGTVIIGNTNTEEVQIGVTANHVSIDVNATPPLMSFVGTANISLPNNASARFQIEGTSVTSADITAANMDKLFNGSTLTATDDLHYHDAMPGVTTITAYAAETIANGAVVVLKYDSGDSRPECYNADMLSTGGDGYYPVGVVTTGGNAGDLLTIHTTGEVTVGTARFDSAPTTADVGQPVFASPNNAGQLLPFSDIGDFTSGDERCKVGILTDHTTAKLLIQVGEPVSIA